MIGKRVPPEQLMSLLLTMFESLADPDKNCSRAATVMINSLLKERGAVLLEKVGAWAACPVLSPLVPSGLGYVVPPGWLLCLPKAVLSPAAACRASSTPMALLIWGGKCPFLLH